MSSEEEFFSVFYYPDQIVTENEGIVEILYILQALAICHSTINNLITLFARALL